MSREQDTPLKRFLSEHGLTQTDLAKGTGLWLSQVNAIVNGSSPRTETVNRILAYVRTVDDGVTYEDLFGRGAAA